jgi:hypothetical protein
MPIRFRCCYCNQLLGIARRKAGSVIECPNCHGQVGVPSLPEGGPAAVPDAPKPPAPGEMRAYQHEPVMEENVAPAPDPGISVGNYLDPGNLADPPAGMALSWGQLTVLTVVVVVLLGVAFGIGLWLGMRS